MAVSKSLRIALLRGINVGGHNKTRMSDLCGLFCDLGLNGAKSLLQSGNVLFESTEPSNEVLEHLLEKKTADRLGVSADYLVRSAQEWERIVKRNPFPEEAKKDPSHLLVMVLKSAPLAKNLEQLLAAIQGPEVVRGDGKQLYISYPAGIGRSKLTATLIERKLETRGTARNWNTVLKLAAMCRGGGNE
jgi:uncharacterized protein (DUF1697 family)